MTLNDNVMPKLKTKQIIKYDGTFIDFVVKKLYGEYYDGDSGELEITFIPSSIGSVSFEEIGDRIVLKLKGNSEIDDFINTMQEVSKDF